MTADQEKYLGGGVGNPDGGFAPQKGSRSGFDNPGLLRKTSDLGHCVKAMPNWADRFTAWDQEVRRLKLGLSYV